MGVDTGDKMNGAGKRRMEMMGHYYAEKMKEAETERPGRNSCPVGGNLIEEEKIRRQGAKKTKKETIWNIKGRGWKIL